MADYDRFRSFAERYIIERASTFTKGKEREEAWQATLDAKTIYGNIARNAKDAEPAIPPRAGGQVAGGGYGIAAQQNSIGAARYYCPWLCSLLPPEHAVNRIDGSVYREPTESMQPIADDMRAAGATVASGLLTDPEHIEYKPLSKCTVQFGSSQRFMLL